MTSHESNFLISVIIPAYNIEMYIGPCLDSLNKQTLPKQLFEVIVVDDCSSDNTYQTASSFKSDLNLKVVGLACNGGPGVARNLGIKEATGEFIFFLDGDDFLPFTALEELSNLMETEQYDLITFNWTYETDLNSGEGYVPRRRDMAEAMPQDREAIIRHFLGMNMDSSVIYTTARKSLFDVYKIEFPDGFHEDISVIFMMYYAASSVLKLNKVLYVKRNIQDSIVNTMSRKHVDGFLGSWPIIMDFLEAQGRRVEDYIGDYYKGMSGLVYTAITKNLIVNSNNFDNRVEIYQDILRCLEKDRYLVEPYVANFPNITNKDKISQLFLSHMSEPVGDAFEKARRFEEVRSRSVMKVNRLSRSFP